MKIKGVNKKKQHLLQKVWRLLRRFEGKGNCDIYRNGELRFLHVLANYYANSNKTVVLFDVGANEGKYAQAAVSTFRKNAVPHDLHIFEPSAACTSTIQRVLPAPDSLTHGIYINQRGVSDRNTAASLHAKYAGDTGASLHTSDERFSKLHEEQVTLTPLHEYISSQAIPHIHLLKLDIEGHELFALHGLKEYLSPTFIDAIQFEYGGRNLDSRTSLAQLYAVLENAGFTVCRLMPQHLERRRYKRGMEDFVYCNYVALSPKLVESLEQY